MRKYKVIPLNILLHLKAEEGPCVGNPVLLTKTEEGMANLPLFGSFYMFPRYECCECM